MVWAVSALCLVTTFHGLDYKVPETVNKVLFSGEAMPMKHLKQWMSHLPEAKFVNLYGPTEITCNCTYHEVDRNRDYAGGLPMSTARQSRGPAACPSAAASPTSRYSCWTMRTG